MDAMDKAILRLVQTDTTLSLDDIAVRVGTSKTPVWNRLKRLRDDGVIAREVAILDPAALGLDTCFFVLVKTSEHDAAWQDRFLAAVNQRQEVIEAHRLAGEVDYILKVRVPNAQAYDQFYQGLISDVKVFNVTALLSMEELKSTTALPL
ncbi:Lrp/AsnC family transcriptional regulator [Luminiphilus sp.]|jgi:Lrp/AsnC family transcriptional regulator|nr:Lrp/AsnC family transcriptional regulator [Luminiphilus sp.]MDA9877720.1 Lrp/AsnC family transcriptional regulator [Luminiphilus sp.]MDB2379799.1 Lrp/AsnC family transcriptional regulator [Luminiphilus sp.]MDB3933385.1 Lrp/AsnC family transcriptional regulator [Luminiphilus sp.]MDC0972974.1 Lrp/AsnC family transcriptional regulator [Luminiphilus sp.]